MAKISNYVKYNYSDFASSSTKNLGYYKIYLNEPRIIVNSNFERYHRKFWLSINDHSYFSEKETDVRPITIEYNFSTGTISPSNAIVSSSEENPVRINPVIPVDTTNGVMATPTAPSGYTHHTATTIYQKCADNTWIPVDAEEFATYLKVNYVDNLFNSRHPSFNIQGNNVIITMSGNYNSGNLPDGEGFPDLIAIIKEELDDQTSDIIKYTKESRTFTLPWKEDVLRGYRLKTLIPELINTTDKDKVNIMYGSPNDGNIPGIDMFNDYLYFNTITLPAMNEDTFRRITGNIISWEAVKNADTYTIYVDGNKYTTVSGTQWVIPDELYYDQIHSYSISVDDNSKRSYSYNNNSGKKTPDSKLTTFPGRRSTTFYIYKGSTKQYTTSAWQNIGYLREPTVIGKWDSLNSYTITLSHTSEAPNAKFYYSDTNYENYTEIEGNTHTFSNLKVGQTYEYYVYISSEINGKIKYSPGVKVSFRPVPLSKPTILSSEKVSINSYLVSFKSSDKPDRYDVYLNGILFKSNATSPIQISGFRAKATNKIKIVSVFNKDSSYNGVTEKTYDSSYTPILSTPKLNKRDIKESKVEQEFGDAGSKEILDNVTTKVELYWSGIQYASGYTIYDKYKIWNNDTQSWEEGERTYPTQTTNSGTEYMNTTTYTLYMDNVQGYHSYSIVAIAAQDEDYNSNVSNTISLEQNFPLDAPVISGDNSTTTISFNQVENADFYSIQLVPSRGTTHTLFRSFTPKEYPFSYNYYDIIKDLKESETFIVSVFSRSYNSFYFHPSEDSNKKSVEVIKLNRPTNLYCDPLTGKLTWSGDSRTYRYEIKIKASDGDWVTYYSDTTEYTFPNLAPSLYTVYVTALRDDSLTNNQPVYLDSEKSDIYSFGHLKTPQDFERNVNVFSWTSVGADRYVFYEDGKSLTTVDGGGVSLELGMVSGAKYRPTEGTHYYQVKAVTIIDNEPWESFLTDPIYVDIKYLNKLSPYYLTNTESYITWDELDTDVVYDTRVNNISEKDLTNENVYTMSKNEEGVYYFKVRSKSTIDEFLYQTSDFSDELLYSVIKLDRPEVSLEVTQDNDTGYDKYEFSWNSVEHAVDYTVVITHNDEETSYIQSNTTYTIFPESGNYTLKVYANGSKGDYPNPKYITSENSNIIRFGVLETPTITLNENVISWDANPLADYYEIYNYGKYFSQTDETQFVLDVSRPYSYSISIRAISNDELVMDSNVSNSVQYTIVQLNTPTNLKLSGDLLTWDLVLNADGYRVFIDDELTFITADTKLNMKDIFATRSGILRIHITAFSNKINFLESDISNFVMKRIEKEKKYNIVIENITYDKIQLPFSMNFKLDETLDTSSLTLAYLDRNEPFQKNTPADIIVYEGVSSSRKFPMVIESDDVVEVQIGTEIKYKHYLQLVERTILLQNEIIPDFTVSSSVQGLLERSETVSSADIGTNTAVKRSKHIDIGTFDILDIPLDWLITFLKACCDLLNIDAGDELDDIPKDLEIPTGIAWFTGIVKDGEIDNVIPSQLALGETFVLPNPTTRLSCFCISVKSLLNTLLEVLGFGDWEDIGGILTVKGAAELLKLLLKRVKVLAKAAGKISWIIAIIIFLIEYIIYMVKILTGKRGYTWGGLLEKLMTTDLSVIGDIFYTDTDWAFPERQYYIRKANASYDKQPYEELISNIPAGFNNKIDIYHFEDAGKYDLILEIPKTDMQELFNKGLIDFESSILGDLKHTKLPSINFMKDENDNQTTFRVVWHDINVSKENISFKHKKISDVLEKVVALTNNKYTIDPKIIQLTNRMKCPDMTFSNGNYLYDVLETIGREFYGIPRLIEDNIITFDILDNNTFSTNQLTFWEDKRVISSISQDLDKVSSGFISRVSNMVPDEDYTIYPAPDMWVSARSDKTDISGVYVDSMAISVDKPIYKINKVFVKNAIIEMKELVIDITKYIYQDVVYNSLNSNVSGKGLALVWKQGDTFIRGLGQLPEANGFFQFMGWNSTQYVIDAIIKDYMTKNIDRNWLEKYTVNLPGEFLFNVEYQGYTDTTLYIENPDKKNYKYAMYSVFNQEDNTISDTRFSNGALSVLKRHNTNIIQREYQSYSILNLPLLGGKLTINNDPYYIDDLLYEFSNSYITAKCNFSKNYNKINPRTAINSEYRQYELRSDNNVNRSINFNEYCILGDLDTNLEKITLNSNWRKVISDGLSGNTHNKPDCFYINCYNNSNLDKIPYLTTDIDGNEISKTIEGIALPISFNRIGTSLSFSAGMLDSFTAGYSSKKENNKDGNLERIQSFVRYVGDDSLEQTPYMRLTLGSLSSYIKNYKTTEKSGKSTIEVTSSDTFPGVPWLEQPIVSLNSPYFSKLFRVYKDQRETLKFNYQMHFISNREDLFIHKGLTKYLFKSPYLSTKDTTPILVGYNRDVSNKDVLDTIFFKLSNVIVDENKISFNTFKPILNFKGMAVIWPDTKEILLEIRKPLSRNEEYKPEDIYLNFSDKIKR